MSARPSGWRSLIFAVSRYGFCRRHFIGKAVVNDINILKHGGKPFIDLQAHLAESLDEVLSEAYDEAYGRT